MTVLLRFAPSPTGALHLGGLRTALVNHLFARKQGGKWILRIEDTDTARTVPGSVDGIRNGLNWAGVDYDFGPGRPGPHGPYYQSERLDLYHSYSKKLLESGHAYRCFCSADRLSETREKLARAGSNSTYDKACLNLTEEEVTRRVKAGEKHVIRLNDSNLPSRSSPSDLVFGAVRDAHGSLPTDPVLLKSDLFPTYHLASVVDDHEMGITHVFRGEEWLPSLPLHLDLYASLGLKPPQFAHLPLLLNPDGSKMSKRKGDVHVMDYVKRGWEPEAILNWLALAGWGVQHEHPPPSAAKEGTNSKTHSPHQDSKQAPDSTTLLNLPEMVEQFDIAALTQRRIVLDPLKLEFFNKHHLMRQWSDPTGLDALANRAHGLVKDAFPTSQYTTVDYIKKVILVLNGRLMNLNTLPDIGSPFFEDPDFTSPVAQAMQAKISADDYNDALRLVIAGFEGTNESEWDSFDYVKLMNEESERAKIRSKIMLTAVRHALSGSPSGPTLPDIMRILGRERTICRLKKAQAENSVR